MMSTKKLLCVVAVAVIAAIVFAAGTVANAALINVNIMSHGEMGEVESSLVGPAGGAGTTWNQLPSVPGNWNPPFGNNLLDSTGATTAVDFSFHLPYCDPWGSPDLTLLHAAYYNPGWSDWGVCEISDLDPTKTYDLYIASYYPNESGSKGTFTTTNATSNGSSQSVDNGGAGGNGSTWVQGENYVLFDDVVLRPRLFETAILGLCETRRGGADVRVREGKGRGRWAISS
jgi:hypothetical protein